MLDDEQVIELAYKILLEINPNRKRGVCLDKLDEACQRETLEEAADVLVLDPQYWDGDLF